MNKIVLEALRPKQWIKNLFVFAALIFSKHLTDLSDLFRVFLAFSAFCAISSSVYLINDINDKEEDRNHPEKASRPIASGRLKEKTAYKASLWLALGAVLGSWLLSPGLAAIIIIYFMVTLIYTFRLKQLVILDVMAIAIGFVLRVIAGGTVINVEISSWLLLCTLMLALFLALNKRRHELVLLDVNAAGHRAILEEYSTSFLDLMIAVVTACTLIAYSLYTISPETVAKFHTNKLFYTIPFVLYGIFRYLYLVHQKEGGGEPAKVLLTDTPLIINGMLWFLTSNIIIYLY
ncbi:MAG: decaprenyl-phosphate phosphoribosyltransferase [bacterium]